MVSPSRQSSLTLSDYDSLDVDAIGEVANASSLYWNASKGFPSTAPPPTFTSPEKGAGEKLMEFLVAISAVRVTGLDKMGRQSCWAILLHCEQCLQVTITFVWIGVVVSIDIKLKCAMELTNRSGQKSYQDFDGRLVGSVPNCDGRTS